MSALPLAADESKKERKKQKRLRKAEERAWLEQRLAEAATASRSRATDAVALTEWNHVLASDRLIAVTKASLLVTLNGVMLAIAAHALYAEPMFGPLVPLALTNLLSLAFSVAAARSVKEGNYEAPVEPLEQSREELLASLSHELKLRSESLAKCRRRLRPAYGVLLGGMLLSAATFGLRLALGG